MKKNKKIAISILSATTAIALATSSVFIIEEAKLNKLIKQQQKLWNDLSNLKDTKLKEYKFLAQIVDKILTDNPVLKLKDENFKQVKLKIDNLKFALKKFNNIIKETNTPYLEKYQKLVTEVENYIKTHLDPVKDKEIIDKLESTKNQTNNTINEENISNEDIKNQIEILEKALEEAKSKKASQNKDPKELAFLEYEKALKNLNNFLNDCLKPHDELNDLYLNEIKNRDLITQNINISSDIKDIKNATKLLIEELKNAKNLAKDKALELLVLTHQKANDYSINYLITPDNEELKTLFNQEVEKDYNEAKDSADVELIFQTIKKINEYIASTDIARQINDKNREAALENLKTQLELAENYINDFEDNRYLEFKEPVAELFKNKIDETKNKAAEITAYANSIAEQIKSLKEKAIEEYQNAKSQLENLKNQIDTEKHPNLQSEISNLIKEQDKIVNNTQSTTRQILDAKKVLSDYLNLLENKKSARENLDKTFENIEKFIKEHTHPEDALTIEKLTELLNETKAKTADETNPSILDLANDSLSAEFYNSISKVNETHEKREAEYNKYEDAASKLQDLVITLDDADFKKELLDEKQKQDGIVNLKDTKTTSKEIKAATDALLAKITDILNKKTNKELEKAKNAYEKTKELINSEKNKINDENIKNDLEAEIAKIEQELANIINDEKSTIKDKVEAYEEAKEKLEMALDKAKIQDAKDDKVKSKFAEFQQLKHQVLNYATQNLKNEDDSFIKTPLIETLNQEALKLEKDSSVYYPEPKDNLTENEITDAINVLKAKLDESKALKQSKDSYEKALNSAKNTLLDIKTEVLNDDDKDLADKLLKAINDSESFLSDDINKTKDNYDQEANKLSNIVNETISAYNTNVKKRKAAKEKLHEKIAEYEKFINDNLKDSNVVKPQHTETFADAENAINEAKSVLNNAFSTEKELLNQITKLNDQLEITKVSKEFDEVAQQAQDFSNNLNTHEEKSIKSELDNSILLEKSNKTSQQATKESIIKAKNDLQQALDEAKKLQKEIYQNKYVSLSQQAQDLLDDWNKDRVLFAANETIIDTLQHVKNTEDSKSLPKNNPDLETIKTSITVLQKAINEAKIAKARIDFERAYDDLLGTISYDNEYQNVKDAIKDYILKPLKDIAEKETSTYDEIIQATNNLTKGKDSAKNQIDQLLEAFNPYLEKYNEVKKLHKNLASKQNIDGSTKYPKIVEFLSKSLETYKETNLKEQEKVDPQKYIEYYEGLNETLNKLKLEYIKQDYELAKADKYKETDAIFDNYPDVKDKYFNETDTIENNLDKELPTIENNIDKYVAYAKAIQALEDAKVNVDKNKSIQDFLNSLNKAKDLKDSLNQNYEIKLKTDLEAQINKALELDSSENYKNVTKETLDDWSSLLDKLVNQTKEQQRLLNKNKEIFDTKQKAIDDAKKLYPDSAATLEQIYNTQVENIKKAIEATPPTIDEKVYSDASEAIDNAIQQAAYNKYNDLLGKVSNFINKDLNDKKYETIKQKLESAKSSSVSDKSTKEELDTAYDTLQKAYDLAQAKKAFDDKYNEILSIVPENSTDKNYDVIRSEVECLLSSHKEIRDDAKSSANEIMMETDKMSKNKELVDKIKQALLSYDKYMEQFKQTKEVLNTIDDTQNEAKEIINSALEQYTLNNIIKTDALSVEKYNEFTTNLQKAQEDALKIVEVKKQYLEELENIQPASDFENYPDTKQIYDEEVNKAKADLETELNNPDISYNAKLNAYEKATKALKDAKSHISKNKAIEDYKKALKSAKDLLDDLNEPHLSKINDNFRLFIESKTYENFKDISEEELQKATNDLKNAIPKVKSDKKELEDTKLVYEDKVKDITAKLSEYTNSNLILTKAITDTKGEIDNAIKDRTIDKQVYESQIAKLSNALLEAKENEAKILYEHKLNTANAYKTLLEDYPETKIFYNNKLSEIKSTLEQSLQNANEDLTLKTDAYTTASSALDSFEKELQSKKALELQKYKEIYETALDTFETFYSKITDEDIKKTLDSYKTEAEKLLIDPLTPSKYIQAKEILESASSSQTKELAFNKFDTQYKLILNTVGEDSKYANIKNAIIAKLKPQKDIRDDEKSTIDQILKATRDLQTTRTQQLINDVKDKYDKLSDKVSTVQEAIDTTYKTDEYIKTYLQKELDKHNENKIIDKLNSSEYTNHKNSLGVAIVNTQTIAQNKQIYTETLQNLKEEVTKIDNAHKNAQQQINAKITQIENALNQNLKAAQGDWEKLKQAYFEANNALKNINIDWYKAIEDYEKEYSNVENYKNTLTAKEYSKVQNDLNKSLKSANTNVNKTNNYENKSVEDINQQTRILLSNKLKAENNVQSIRNAKTSYDTAHSNLTNLANNAKYADWKTEITDAIKNADTVIKNAQDNLKIDADTFNNQKDLLENKLKEIVAKRYQVKSSEASTLLDTIKDKKYQDLWNYLNNEKNNNDEKALPERKPTQEVAEQAYTDLDKAIQKIKADKNSRDKAFAAYSEALKAANEYANTIEAENSEIETRFKQKIKDIENDILNAQNAQPTSISDQKYYNAATNLTTEIENTKLSIQKRRVDNLLDLIDSKLSEKIADRIEESSTYYEQLKDIKETLENSKMLDNYEDIKNKVDSQKPEVEKLIQNIDDNIKKYNEAHAKAGAKLNELQSTISKYEEQIKQLIDVNKNWGNSTYISKSEQIYKDKAEFQQLIDKNKSEYNALKEKWNSKSIAKNNEINVPNFEFVSTNELTAQLDRYKSIAQKWIGYTEIGNKANGFNGHVNGTDFNTLEGYTKDASTYNLFNDITTDFIKKYEYDRNTNTPITLEKYVEYRNKLVETINKYENEMRKLKPILGKYVGYNEKGEAGEFVQAFRYIYKHIYIAAGWAPFNNFLNFHYKYLHTTVDVYETFEEFKVPEYDTDDESPKAKTYSNLTFADLYNTILKVKRFCSTNDKESLYRRTNELVKYFKENLFAVRLKRALYPQQYWVKDYDRYFWDLGYLYTTIRPKFGDQNQFFSFNGYIRLMVVNSLLSKLGKNHNGDELHDLAVQQLVWSKDGSKAQSYNYDEYARKVKVVMTKYFDYIDKYCKTEGKNYKQLLFWDGYGNEGANTKVLGSLNYYVNSNSAGFRSWKNDEKQTFWENL